MYPIRPRQGAPFEINTIINFFARYEVIVITVHADEKQCHWWGRQALRPSRACAVSAIATAGSWPHAATKDSPAIIRTVTFIAPDSRLQREEKGVREVSQGET